MAERRMFAKTIIDSDDFLDMPLSTQALYFHLSMRADDDGFTNNPKKIMRMIGASQDELKFLLSKRFLIGFDTGVIVIKHWKIHNYIRSDRYKATIYQDEMKMLDENENKSYTEKKVEIPNDNQVVYQMDTQVRLDEVRLGEVSIDNTPIEFKTEPKPKSETVQLFEYYLEVGLTNHKKLTESMKKSAKMAFKDYTLDELKEMLDRHKQVVDITKSEKQFTVKKRTFAEFFGQKVKDAKILICEEYTDDGPKWSHYKGVIESGTAGKQQDNAIANAVQGITRKQHTYTTEGDEDLL